MSNYQRTADWLKACGKTPSAQNLSLQIGCHIEEFIEFLNCLDFDSASDLNSVECCADDLRLVATALKRGTIQTYINPDMREAALDALCDCEVTGNGVAYLAEFNKPAADEAVLASNEAKLVDDKPVILPGGKIGKPEGWTPPDLTEFV